MSVAHSPATNLTRNASRVVEETLKCASCNEELEPQVQECCILETCQHVFHRSCIEEELSNSSQCALCKTACELANLKKYPILNIESTEISTQTAAIKKSRPAYRGKGRGSATNRPTTRSLGRTLFSENPNTSMDFEFPSNNLTDVRENVQVQSNQNNSYLNSPQPVQTSQYPNNINQNPNTQESNIANPINIDYAKINQMIAANLMNMLQNLNIGTLMPNTNNNQPPRINTSQNYPPQTNMNISNTNFQNRNSENSTPLLRSDRVTFIIQNWNLQFDASNNGLSVDEFLYRIRTLTKEHLNNDFSHICKNLPLILSGKAKEWYWRYHKTVDSIQWNEFCGALRAQFKDLRSDYDLMEAIRSRKMRTNESFDSFYDSICSIADRLRHPIPEEEMVEILIRNLRTDIRHELLYVPIFTLSHLRKLVQMRENLLNDESFKKNLCQKPSYTNVVSHNRKNVAEVQYDESSDIPLDGCIDALKKDPSSIKCWNCDEIGHYWDDCLKDRTVFCYGCGSKNVYKPQCLKCNSRKHVTQSKNCLNPHPNPRVP